MSPPPLAFAPGLPFRRAWGSRSAPVQQTVPFGSCWLSRIQFNSNAFIKFLLYTQMAPVPLGLSKVKRK